MESKKTSGKHKLEELFKSLDKDTSKCLNRQEVKDLLKKGNQNVTEPQLDEVFTFFNEGGDQKITYEEFINGLIKSAQLYMLADKNQGKCLTQNKQGVDTTKAAASNVKCKVKLERYYMTYSGKQFEDYVIDKFENVIPEDVYNSTDFKEAIKESKIKSIVPKINYEGKIFKTCTIGIAILKKLKELERIGGVWRSTRGMNTKLGKNKKPVVEDYHGAQAELLPLLEINCDDKDKKNTKRFVQELDKKSRSTMEATQPEDADLIKKIMLCLKVLVLRLWVHQHSMMDDNDFMDEQGWRNWQRHTWVCGSFAVYFLCLQLVHKKQRGNFYDVLVGHKNTQTSIRMASMTKKAGEDPLLELFKRYDKDNSNSLSRPELEALLKEGNRNDVLVFFDDGGDKKITYEELKNVLEKLTKIYMLTDKNQEEFSAQNKQGVDTTKAAASNVPCNVERHYMTYSGKQFQDYVIDKFKNFIPEGAYIDNAVFEEAIKISNIESLVPKINNNGSINKTCTVGIAMLEAIDELKSVEDERGGYTILPEKMEEVMKIMRDAEKKLLEFLGISMNLTSETDQKKAKLTVAEIDEKSRSILNATQTKDGDLIEKIELCHKVLFLRLLVHQHSMKDEHNFMDETSWNNWHIQTLASSSIAVYFLCLQLDFMNDYEEFYCVYDAKKKGQ